MAPRKADAAFAIEYLQEHPEAGLCCDNGDWWDFLEGLNTNPRSLLQQPPLWQQPEQSAPTAEITEHSGPNQCLQPNPKSRLSGWRERSWVACILNPVL
jgi:hypothetical protein